MTDKELRRLEHDTLDELGGVMYRAALLRTGMTDDEYLKQGGQQLIYEQLFGAECWSSWHRARMAEASTALGLTSGVGPNPGASVSGHSHCSRFSYRSSRQRWRPQI